MPESRLNPNSTGLAGKFSDMSPADFDYAMETQTDSVMANTSLKASLAMYLGVSVNQYNSFQQIYFVKDLFGGGWEVGSRQVLLLLIWFCNENTITDLNSRINWCYSSTNCSNNKVTLLFISISINFNLTSKMLQNSYTSQGGKFQLLPSKFCMAFYFNIRGNKEVSISLLW